MCLKKNIAWLTARARGTSHVAMELFARCRAAPPGRHRTASATNADAVNTWVEKGRRCRGCHGARRSRTITYCKLLVVRLSFTSTEFIANDISRIVCQCHWPKRSIEGSPPRSGRSPIDGPNTCWHGRRFCRKTPQGLWLRDFRHEPVINIGF